MIQSITVISLICLVVALTMSVVMSMTISN
jgi:hypothetical protein